MMKSAIVIAEIGCNHMGDIDLAKKMIDTAKNFCDVNVIKFQKRNPKECLTETEYNAPHPIPYNSYGTTYGEHREFLEFNLEQHVELKNYCDKLGMIYSTSVWDLTSAKEIASIEPAFIKIPSAANTHFEMLEYLCTNYMGELHISLGMTTHQEEDQILHLLQKYDRNSDAVLYSCTSGYPVPDEDVCLLEIKRLKEKFGNEVKSIGFSGHHNGIAIDIAAFVLGAEYIERHYTLNRTFKGTDHAASLEPDGLRRLARDLKSVASAMNFKPVEILDIENVQRKKLKWNCKEWC